MSYEVKGTLDKILPIQTGVSKATGEEGCAEEKGDGKGGGKRAPERC